MIQPFDNGGEFDRRFTSTIKPTLVEAELEAYRVDKDPSTEHLIESIQNGISDSLICLADISNDNPNVWYEVGYAKALGKQLVMICRNSRSKFPFDVSHFPIIKYATDSEDDFKKLRADILERVISLADKARERVMLLAQPVKSEGSDLHQTGITFLSALASELPAPDAVVNQWDIKRQIISMGYNGVVFTLGLKLLQNARMVKSITQPGPDGEVLYFYGITETGWDWYLKNMHRFDLERKSTDDPPF